MLTVYSFSNHRNGQLILAGLTARDWGNLRLLAAIIAVVVMFRIGYEQSGNVIALTPFLMRHWAHRSKLRGPANLLARMSLGCAIAALSMAVMIAAAAINAKTGHLVGAEWVIAYFVLLTIGELLVIPVGLTLVGALSPVQVAAMAMGAWYIAKFLGSLLAGAMGAYWGQIPATLFFGLGATSVLIAAIFLLILSRMRPIRIG